MEVDIRLDGDGYDGKERIFTGIKGEVLSS